VSLQIEILKVLSGRPEGRASVEDLKSDLTFFNSLGTEWIGRMRQLAGRAPGLKIFSQGLVVRDQTGWQLTTAGRDFLDSVEALNRALSILRMGMTETAPFPKQCLPMQNVVYLDCHRAKRAGPPQDCVQLGGVAGCLWPRPPG
jgi:hypothetical protein